ncbi:MAG: ZIP family metal transporter [Myxococcales bacterium]
MIEQLKTWIEGAPVFLVGTLASAAASLGTSVGALPLFSFTRVSPRVQDLLMSTAAGIMLAASAYSLVQPGIDEATRQFGTPVRGAAVVAVSVLLGAAAILLIHRHAPHEHFIKGPDNPAVDLHRLRRVWLFVIAITLHNFPEGLAVGVGFGGGRVDNGLALTTAIFVQNLPEGFVVALALLGQGYTRLASVAIAAGTGLVETVGGVLGAAAVSLAGEVLPWALGFAGGAMLFVISHEIIPETHREGETAYATFGLVSGFVGMLLLEAALS